MNLFHVPTTTADWTDSDLKSRDCVTIKGQRKQGGPLNSSYIAVDGSSTPSVNILETFNVYQHRFNVN